MRRIYLIMLVLVASAMQLRAQNNWMASLPDNVYITQLSIPGAHDAATSGMTLGINKTQALTIPNQWEAGVRAFDLRPKKNGEIYHSSSSTRITLTQALGYLKTKLQANPTEFAIVLMRNESNGGANEDGWQTAIKPILDAYAAADGNYRGTVEWNNRLRLSDVRGKILILTRDAVDNTRAVTIGSWADDATYAMTTLYNDQFRIVFQDKYSDGASNTKKDAITALLNEAMTIHNPFRLYLNHTSASTNPSSYASKLNEHACNYLDAHPNVGPTGIIMMDYAGDGNGSGHYGASLVAKIIANNNANTLLPVFEGPAGEYFLQNVETGLWVQSYQAIAGADRARWNTAANMGTYGRPFLLQNFADDNWTLNTQAGADQILGCGYGDGGLIYLDWGSGEAKRWRITGTKDAAHINTWWDRWLSVNNDNILNHDASAKDTWKLWTREERLATLPSASEAKPIDVTWLMVNPELMNNDRMTPQWTSSRDGGGEAWQDGFRPNRIYETWGYSNLDFYQTITVPNGKYRLRAHALYSPTGGGSLNSNDYNSWNSNGASTVKAVLYANNKQVALPSIYSYTNTESKADDTTKDLGNGKYAIDGWKQAARAMGEDDKFLTDPLRVDVAGGSLRLGIKKTEAGASTDWVIIGNFSLEYLGLLDNEMEALRSELSGLINDTFTGNTTDILQSNYDTAYAAATAAIADDNSSAATLTTCINNLRNAITAARAVDDTALERTITLAGEEGISTTEAESVTANGLTADEVNNALNTLRVARKVLAADKQEDIFTGSDPEDGGKYYLYNIGAQRYLTGGVEYGTHTAVNFAAQLATFEKSGDGYIIYTNIRNNSDILGHNGFVDLGRTDENKTNNVWYFIKVADGVYNISRENTNTGATLLGYSGDRRNNWWQVDSDNSGADQAINQWKLITKEERDALLDEASEDNPVDATYYIHAAGFDHYLPNADQEFPTQHWLQWWEEGHEGNHDIAGWEPDFNFETWDAGNFKLYQELTGLKPGKYILGVQGYYRHGNKEQAANEEAAGKTKADGAILYAKNGNDETFKEYLVPIVSEADKVPGIGYNSSVGRFPDSRGEEVAHYFETGLYKNTVEVIVEADGTLEIGMEKFENNQGNEWVVLDNFRLTYLGGTLYVDESTAAPSSARVDLKGSWNKKKFAEIDNEYKAAVYSIGAVAGIGTDKEVATLNPNTLFVGTDGVKFSKNTIKWNTAAGATSNYIAVSPIVFTDGYELNTNTLYNFTANQGVTYSRGNVNMLNYATVVVPFDAPVPNAFTAFGIDTEEKNGEFFITFREASSLEAGKPYLLRPVNPTDEKQTMTLAVSGEGKAVVFGLDNSMTYARGTYTFMTRPEGKNYYGVSSSPAANDHIKLSKLSGTGRVNPFRIYFEVPVDGDGNEAKINMAFEEATGIRQATAEEIGQLFDIYSVNGQLVKKNSNSTLGLPAGVYIVNGKKVVIK